MAEAGCVNVSLGFESGSLPVLQKMNKRFTPNEVRDISGLFGDAGIERMGFLLLGGPGETRETVEESLAFADGSTWNCFGSRPASASIPTRPLRPRPSNKAW